jgi:hypothetical protein
MMKMCVLQKEEMIFPKKLWSITANVVLASIWSPSNSCLFGTYLSNRLWYTKFPVWQNSLKYLMSFLKRLLSTTSFNAHKDKAFIKRPTQKERENGLSNQFIIKSLTSG